MQEMKPLKYENNTYNLPDGVFRISPSMVAKFNDKKHEWYRSQVLGENTFEGNTSTVLGTCVHRMAEYFLKGIEPDYNEINNYIDSLDLDIDKSFIKEQYVIMGRTLIKHLSKNTPNLSEQEVIAHMKDNVYVGGTYDALDRDILIDFKITSSKNPSDTIPYYYKWQMLTYAYALRKNNIPVNFIKLIWITTNETGRISDKTGKPLKDYPSVVKELIEPITEDDMRFIEDYLNLITETYLEGIKNPKLIYLLYADYRLKDRFDSPFS